MGQYRTPTLTERDRDVLELVAQGRSNGQIATELHLSVKTVQNHVSSLLTRSGCATRGLGLVGPRSRRPVTPRQWALSGVSDGTRTRGHLDHNQVLYQLSYTHHAAQARPAESIRARVVPPPGMRGD